MKTLDQIEPRTPVTSAATPGDADSLFRITRPGSYYLTENITGAVGRHGIEIAAQDVSLDLEGFGLLGVPGSLDGVFVSGALTNIAVRNGSVRSWGVHGINAANARNGQWEELRLSHNGSDGLRVGTDQTISQCVASLNATNGIVTGSGATVTSSAANGNRIGRGISAGPGSTVAHCSTAGNGVGISVDSGSTITACSAYFNDGHGFAANTGCSINNCTAANNGFDGIRVVAACYILNNNGHGNGSVIGAGIHVLGSGNRVDQNTLTGNDRGVKVDIGGNLITRNSARGNSAHYEIVAGNTVGPIVNAGNIAASTNPHANYEF